MAKAKGSNGSNGKKKKKKNKGKTQASGRMTGLFSSNPNSENYVPF